jgi:ATP-dependent RNA helicase RhlE
MTRHSPRRAAAQPRHATPRVDVPDAFAALGLHGQILRGVGSAGYQVPTPIQLQAVPHALDGRDVVGCAQTGTGKTAAFMLPTLQTLASTPAASSAAGRRNADGRAPGMPRALVVTPTRELAAQILSVGRTLAAHTGQRLLAVYGGIAYGPQAREARRGVDLLVATPGRLLDMMNRGDVSLADVSILILDEADRMLDMGFWPDIKRISDAVPAGRQSLFFSATMTREVLGAIKHTLSDPVFLDVAGPATTVDNVTQSVLPVAHDDKVGKLVEYLLHHEPPRALVFTRTRRRADRVARTLNREGVACAAIHGDRSQSQRDKALDGFRGRSIRVLVATDVVARGIDVDGITHVINFDIPVSAEDYVHRIGRTARAGSSGEAVTLLTADDGDELRAIERLIGATLTRRGVRDIAKSEKGAGRPAANNVHHGGSRDESSGDAVRYMGETRRYGAAVGSPKRQGAGMAQGTVKWFNGQKGYGFIAQEGEKDVFVHVNDLAPGVGTLNENQAVEFDVQEGRKGPQAVNVRPV